MFGRSSRKKRTFNRIVLSYFAVFLLPLAIIILLVQLSFINRLYENIRQSTQNDIAYAFRQLDADIEQLHTIVSTAIIDPQIHFSYDPDRRPIQVQGLQKRLRILSMNAKLPENTRMYFKGDPFIYTQSTTYTLEFSTSAHRIEGLRNAAEFSAVMESLETTRVFPAMNMSGTGGLLIAQPIKGTRATGSCCFSCGKPPWRSILKKYCQSIRVASWSP